MKTGSWKANDQCSLPKITNPVLSAQPKISVITMICSVLKEYKYFIDAENHPRRGWNLPWWKEKRMGFADSRSPI